MDLGWLSTRVAFSGAYTVHFVIGLVGVLSFAAIYLWWRHRATERHASELRSLTEDLRRSQEAMAQSEERFRKIFEEGPIGIAIASPDARVLRVNRAFCEMLGYPEAELLGLAFRDIVHPEDAPAFLREARLLFQNEIPRYELELRLVTRARESIWVKWMGSFVSRQDGGHLYALSMVEDITQRRLAEARLRQSEERFSKAFHASPLPISIATLAEGRFIDVNESFLRAMAISRDAVIGRTATELGIWLHPSDRADFTRRLQEQGSVRNTELQHRIADGTLRRALVAADLIELNGQPCILALSLDITERQHAEDVLRKTEERFRLMARATNDAVWDWDLLHNTIWWNEGIKTLFGYSPDQASFDASWWDLHIHPEDHARVVSGMQEVIQQRGQAWSAEYRYRRADGSYADVFDRGYVIHDEQGTPVRMIGAIMDITERKQYERTLARSRDQALELTRLKSAFLANISHEVRTPLNGIVGMSVLLQDTPLTVAQQSIARTIKSSSEALLAIVNDILDFSRMEAGKLGFESADFDLRSLMESTIEMVADRAQGKHVELICLVNGDVPVALRGDPNRLRQVVVNLVVNATKFTHEGEILVRVAREHETEEEVVLHCSVSDTGIGIAPEAIPYLFQSFSQIDLGPGRNPGGTGLGLAISKQIVEMMNGRIGVESTPGKGSTFWFTVRLQKQPSPPPASPVRLEGLRAVVASLHNASRRQLLQHLKALQIEADPATSGSETLALLREAQARQAPYAMLLLDQHLPDTSALALAQAIKADSRIASTRLILLASGPSSGDTSVLRTAGVRAFLSMPIKQSLLLGCLTSVLTAKSEHETRFWLDRKPKPEPQPAPILPAHPEGIRVLVAEDNPVNQRVALGLLEKLGCHAQAYGTGLEVLQALAERPYDIVLMDCQLPGIDGFETTRRIRQRDAGSASPNPRPHIIATTAYAVRGTREQCLASGMDDYLCKPITVEALREALLAWSKSPHPRAPSAHETPPPTTLLAPRAVQELLALRQEGKPDLAAELVDLFLSDAVRHVSEMTTAIARYDNTALELAAHSLRGSASTVGASTLSALCAAIEDSARAKSIQTAAHLVRQVDAELARVRSALLVKIGVESPPPNTDISSSSTKGSP